MMYDELIKSLRICADQGKCNGCKYDEIDIPSCHNPLMREAADAIEYLQKQLEESYNSGYTHGLDDAAEVDLVKKMSYWWIPVTERLPEDRNMVLATVDGVVRIAFYGNYMWEEVETYSIFYPTHWMPLPQPPKDGEV